MGLIRCAETLVTKYQPTSRSIAEERRPGLQVFQSVVTYLEI